MPKGPLKAGSELDLLVSVTNNSNRVISFITSPGEIPEDGVLYQIDVRDAQGHTAPLSTNLHAADARIPINNGSRFARELEPGKSFIDRITVTRFYDLSCPGEYTISVARPMPPHQNLGKGSDKSNTITVTVTR
jgi:hypothetical protein